MFPFIELEEKAQKRHSATPWIIPIRNHKDTLFLIIWKYIRCIVIKLFKVKESLIFEYNHFYKN